MARQPDAGQQLRAEVRRWLREGERDLRAARVLQEHGGETLASAGFHAQQAAEKWLKAVLVRHGVPTREWRTHDLAVLVSRIGTWDASLEAALRPCAWLTDLYSASRYPDAWEEIGEEKVRKAIREARSTRKHVRAYLAPWLRRGRRSPEGPP